MKVIFRNTSLRFVVFKNIYDEANNTKDNYVSTGSVAGSYAYKTKVGSIGNHISGIAGKTLKLQVTLHGSSAPQNSMYAVLADADGIVKEGYGYGDTGFGSDFWATGTTKEGSVYTKVITIPSDADDLYLTIRFSDVIYFDNIVISEEVE